MFTTKFTKGAKNAQKPFVKKYAEGGTVEEDDPGMAERIARAMNSGRNQAQRALRSRGETMFGLARSPKALAADRKSDMIDADYVSRKVRRDLREED